MCMCVAFLLVVLDTTLVRSRLGKNNELTVSAIGKLTAFIVMFN